MLPKDPGTFSSPWLCFFIYEIFKQLLYGLEEVQNQILIDFPCEKS